MHIRSDVARAAEPVMLQDDDGEVAVYAVPYLEPDVVRPLLAADAPDPAAHPRRRPAGRGRPVP